MDQITEYVQAEAGHEANVIFGMGTDESLGEKINVTIIATGFEGGKEEKRIVMALETAVEKQKEAPKPLDSNINSNRITYSLDGSTNNEQSAKIGEEKKDIIQDPKSLLDFKLSIKEPNDVPIQQTSTNEENLRRQNERVTHLKNIRDKIRPIPVSDMETVPAFRRKGLKLNDVPPSNETVISRWEMWKDPETNSIVFRKGENGYLHDPND